jgi:hypothetical protein
VERTLSGEYSADEGYFIETDARTSTRWGTPWTPEAGPFKTEADAFNWLESNRHKLMYPDAEARIVYLTKDEI